MVGPRHARMAVPSPASQLIERAHLADVIEDRPVVVLAGMAGYGKSTLLADVSRRQQVKGATIWLGVDDSDRSPVRLVADLVTAVSLSGIEELGADLGPRRAADPGRLAARGALRRGSAVGTRARRPAGPHRRPGLDPGDRPRPQVGAGQPAHRRRRARR